MIRTNSKKFKTNFESFLKENLRDCDYGIDFESMDLKTLCNEVFRIAREEGERYNTFNYETFKQYMQGLPSLIYSSYWLNGGCDCKTSFEVLRKLLEQTEEYQKKFDIEQANEYLTKLIWDSLNKFRY